MPEYRQQLVEVKIQSILTLADAVVLVQHLGLKLALQFICSVILVCIAARKFRPK